MTYDAFLLWLRANGVPEPDPEVYFAEDAGRRWRFDYAWVDHMLALEVEGGVFAAKSRHTSGHGYRADCEKYSEAAVRGWAVIRRLPEDLMTAVTLDLIQRGLARSTAVDE